METPIHLDFQGMAPLDRLREKVEGHVAVLEARFGRITSCRVALKSPGERHRTGAPYEVYVHLLLPNGKDVNIDRTRHADERFADANFAVNDAFRRARRRLKEEAQRLSGEIKAHQAQPVATVLQLNGDFGFLEADDGRDEIYFHRNSVLKGSFAELKVGSRVAFVEEAGEKGRQASAVRLLGRGGRRRR